MIFGPAFKDLPGETETQKFQYALDIAPPWLLKFAFAPLTAAVLGLKCPDLSRAPREGQIAVDAVLRWALPNGTLQAGGPVRPFKEETLTNEERRKCYEEAAELVAEAYEDCINEGIMPNFDPRMRPGVRGKNRRRRQGSN